MVRFFVFIAYIIVFTASVLSQTIIEGGNVSGIWTKTQAPYLINDEITIPNDSTLTIEAGVVVEFQGHHALWIQGTLLAVGSESDTILFTVNDTSEFSDPDTTLGGWYGLRFIDTPLSNDSSKIVYCKLEYGKAVADVWYLNSGGAICVINFGKILISNSRLTNNIAGGPESNGPAGGAIHLFHSDIKIKETTFSHNSANNGGAIQYYESNPTFINCTFINNLAIDGAGLLSNGVTSNTTTMINCTLMDNHSQTSGGGIRFGDNSLNILENVTFSGNTAEWGAGIGATSCELELNNCTFTNNTASNLGGGLAADDCTLRVENSIFRNNSGKWSGGIHSWQNELYVDNCLFEENTAIELSGGIHADFTNLMIENSTFKKNTANMSAGIHSWYSTIEVKSCSFTENTADFGGGIHCDYSHVNIDSSQFILNSAKWGGGIHAYNSDLQIDSCSFVKNTAVEGDGGGIEYRADSTIFGKPYQMELINSRFRENEAIGLCGGVRIEQINSEISLIDINVDHCEFSQNHADRYGPFQISGNIADFILANSLFRSNTAKRWVSGPGFISGCTGKVYNCIFSSNYANYTDSTAASSGLSLGLGARIDFFNCTFNDTSDAGGYGLSVRRGGTATITNSIIWGCGNYPITINTVSDSGGSVYVNYCNLQDGTDSIHVSDSLSTLHWGTGNIAQDPQFVDLDNGDFHLEDTSPSIGAGINCFQLNDLWMCAPEFDMEGVPRPTPEGTDADMGAYENSLGGPSALRASIEQVPTRFRLAQNYPNPFNPRTIINYELAIINVVEISVYNLLGQKVATLVNKRQNAGIYQVEWDASLYASGIYYYKIVAGDFQDVKKMILIK